MTEPIVLIDDQSTILYNNQTSLALPQSDNLPPVGTDDSGSSFEDEIFYGNVLSNDSDPEGDPIIVSSVNGFTDAVGKPLFLASGAIVTVNADGNYSYDPNGQFDALNDGETANDSFQYTIDDSVGEGANAGNNVSLQSITIDDRGEVTQKNIPFQTVTQSVNGKIISSSVSLKPPIANNDTFSIRKDGSVNANILQNDSNPEGGNLAVTAISGLVIDSEREFLTPKGAKVSIRSRGDYTYNPNSQFNNLLEGQTATESFDYTIINNGRLPATAKITVTIQGFNDVPPGFDAAQYGASNPDLIPIYRNDLAGLTTHYLLHGRAENRPLDNFDEFRYVASSYPPGYNGDLIGAFGLNGAAATQHYLTHGFFEGRSKTAFIPSRYLDSHDDLINAPSIGTNTLAATQHYITHGFAEKRDPNLFPSDRYIASHRDLINAFHYDIEAGSNHYLFSGRGEGRKITFDPLAYMAKNPDIAALYQNDPNQATFHYITHGFTENRLVA